MTLHARAAALLVLFALALVPAPPVRADDVALARERFKAGADLFKAKRYREAIQAFEDAYRLKPHGAIHYNVAQCRERLEEWPGALRSYTDYLREVPDARDRAAVRAAIGRLEARLAAAGVQALLVYTDPPGADLRIDGRARGQAPAHIALPPATYRLGLALEGYEPVEEDVELSARASRVVDVVLRARQKPAATAGATPTPAASPIPGPPPSPAPPPSATPGPATTPAPDLAARPPPAAVPLPPAPVRAAGPAPKGRLYTWIAAGAAVAAAGAGAYYGLAARADERKLADGTARLDAAALADGARRKARTANVLYGVSGAFAAGAATLFVVEGRF